MAYLRKITSPYGEITMIFYQVSISSPIRESLNTVGKNGTKTGERFRFHPLIPRDRSYDDTSYIYIYLSIQTSYPYTFFKVFKHLEVLEGGVLVHPVGVEDAHVAELRTDTLLSHGPQVADGLDLVDTVVLRLTYCLVP